MFKTIKHPRQIKLQYVETDMYDCIEYLIKYISLVFLRLKTQIVRNKRFLDLHIGTTITKGISGTGNVRITLSLPKHVMV